MSKMYKKCHTPANRSNEINRNQNNKNNCLESWNDQEIHIVDSIEKCQRVIEQLRLHCNEYNVLGFSCDHVNYKKQKIALLQLATHRGLCVLIRLSCLHKIPKELQIILEDEKILKIAVNPNNVALKLIAFGVRTMGLLDLRYLAMQCHFKPLHLPGLSKMHLNVTLIENNRLNHSRWKRTKTEQLNLRDVEYEAKIVRVLIELFKLFKEKLMTGITDGEEQFINKYCMPYLNKVFRNQKEEEEEEEGEEMAENGGKMEKNDDLFRNQKICLVSSTQECQTVVQQLRAHCVEYAVLGFACKYKPSQRIVTLLQLSTHRGLCVLIQLGKLKTIPDELREILEDANIYKVGIRSNDGIGFDIIRLELDYGVCVASSLDLRHLAKECQFKADSLGYMSKKYFNIDICLNDWRLLSTDWKADIFFDAEINHAAQIVHISIELFKIFEQKLMNDKCLGNRTKFIDEFCSPYLNETYPTTKLKTNVQRKELTNTLPEQDIRVISTDAECRTAVEQLKLHCTEYNVIGLDCEWVPYGRTKVAMLQLASHRGLCLLIRLCQLNDIPITLQNLLKDDTIQKVGISIKQDAKKLFQDYKIVVAGVLDLRYLAKKCGYKSSGLGNLCEEVLNVQLAFKKRGLVTNNLHKKWHKPTLDDVNIKYAANDVHASIELFKKFEEKLMAKSDTEQQKGNIQQFIDLHCKTLKYKKSMMSK